MIHAPNAPIRVLTSVAILAALVACGGVAGVDDQSSGALESEPDEPVYYVDGARPSPGLNEGVQLSDTTYAEGCVPWSESRTDVLVCGPIDDSYKPPPPPGDYEDYPAVCDAASLIVAHFSKELSAAYELKVAPEADVKSCGAGGLGSEQDATWQARFGLANVDDVAPYESVVVRGFVLDGADGDVPTVYLSEEPWPPE